MEDIKHNARMPSLPASGDSLPTGQGPAGAEGSPGHEVDTVHADGVIGNELTGRPNTEPPMHHNMLKTAGAAIKSVGQTLREPVVSSERAYEVRALRDGFYLQQRKKEGDIFKMAGPMENVGSWVECTDKTLEKKHKEVLKAKREKENQAGK